jgi:tetratricopeptide (TPR) repeat protein
MPSVISLIGAVFFLSTLPAQVFALTPDQVFDKVKDSIVVVKTLDAQGKVRGQGSGVLLPSGKIATNCHVVEGGASYQVGRGKELVRATLYAEDGDKDICLLDAKGLTGKPAQLGKAANLKVGVPVYAVGAPKGLELSLSDGIVAQLRGGPPPFIQTTAAISPGSSGGGLFDGEGRLVGLTTLYIEGGQSLNFAMPVEWIGEIKPGRKTVAKGHSQSEWVKRAIALEKLKDWQGLLYWCLKWTKSEPKDANAWFCLGMAYDELKRYDDAVDAYRQSLRLDPEHGNFVWFFLGGAYEALKRYDDAIEAFRQAALCANPERAAGVWSLLGHAYGKRKRYDDAIEAYRQSLRIDQKDARTWYMLGMAYDGLKRYDDAIEAYRQALRINPEHGGAFAWTQLGFTYDELNRYNDAIEAYRQSLLIDPNNATTWSDIGRDYGILKRNNDAIEAFRQSLRIDPKDASVWFFLGVVYVRSGNLTAALDTVKELRRLDPAKADELFNMIGPR